LWLDNQRRATFDQGNSIALFTFRGDVWRGHHLADRAICEAHLNYRSIAIFTCDDSELNDPALNGSSGNVPSAAQDKGQGQKGRNEENPRNGLKPFSPGLRPEGISHPANIFHQIDVRNGSKAGAIA